MAARVRSVATLTEKNRRGSAASCVPQRGQESFDE
jgi:hypothetical protein